MKDPTKIKTKENLSKSQVTLMKLFTEKAEEIVGRDEIAKAVWGSNWLDKYSDWAIDRHIYRLNKIAKNFKIKAVRERGYYLKYENNHIDINKIKSDIPLKKVPGTSPTRSYLKYMNNPDNLRKVMKDLFDAVKNEGLTKYFTKIFQSKEKINILAINSYSYDNVDAILDWLKKNKRKDKFKVYFTNFDELALEIHKERVEELNLKDFITIYDDIRNTRLENGIFDIIINDFRLNFNTDHSQNKSAMRNISKLLKKKGLLLVSVVVDSRYESSRFGNNQQKAPINKKSPWIFEGKEGLERFCFTIPYYKKLFNKTGFKIIKEFGIEEGKNWTDINVNPDKGIYFRRYLLKLK